MDRRQKNAEEELTFADNHTQANRILQLFVVNHPRKIELLGECWSTCDTYPAEMRLILDALPCPAMNAMTEEERGYLGALPGHIRVWRGCYDHNRFGFSWTENRAVAERFPRLDRYRCDGKTPILLQGMVNSKDILFVKLDRAEWEIVPRPGTVTIIEETEIVQQPA